MPTPVDKYGIPLAIGKAVHDGKSSICGEIAVGQIADIVPPGPALAVSSDPNAATQRTPGKIIILYERHILFDDQHLTCLDITAIVKEAPLDWVKVPAGKGA